MSAKLVVLGAGGHAKVVIATAQALGYEVIGAYDDGSRAGQSVLGIPILGNTAEAVASNYPAVLGIGSNRVRHKLSSELSCEWICLVHPAAVVHESVVLGAGTVIFAGVVVQPETVIGDHVILNTGSSVDHDCQLGNAVHVGPGARLCGGVSVGEGSLLGVGSAVIPGVNIGSWCSVGAGAAVIRDCGDGKTVVGIPAQERR
tara:strand:- start:71598 stop:72203 length:606 start_codon:yes stop_codon:yes gene_type:complete